MQSFFEEVYGLTRKIPKGKVVSYGQIAVMLDAPRAARTVGWAMSRSPDDVPWQRVIMNDGSVSKGVATTRAKELLRNEGVKFLPDGRVDMKSCRWNGKES